MTCLEVLVEVPEININKQNKKEGNTPLHLAVLYEEDFEVALSMVNILLDCGADPRYSILKLSVFQLVIDLCLHAELKIKQAQLLVILL